MSAISATIAAARNAQVAWRAVPVRERLHALRHLRGLLARDGAALAEAAGAGRGRPPAEKLTSEVIPLAEAARFLERRAARLLRPRRLGWRMRPIWLAGVEAEIHREPFGVVLIVGPGNYPLFLPGVQTLQALAAGNAVLWKPGVGGTAAASALHALLEEAGLPAALLHVLPEDIGEVYAALDAGVDLLVFTGSTAAGKLVLQAAAARALPAIAELSGDDSVVVCDDADLDLVERALSFTRSLNGGDSCIAPRRLIAPARLAGELRRRLPDLPLYEPDPRSADGLGAAIFSRDIPAARALALQIQAGVVVVNDCIFPTADPRLPFGGRGASGYGVTRGAEGLLALTRPKAICIQRGVRRHLEPAQPGDAAFFLAALRALHGGSWRERVRAVAEFLRLGRARGKTV